MPNIQLTNPLTNYIQLSAHAQSFPSQTYMYAGYDGDAYKAFVVFSRGNTDWTILPAGANITAAKLYLYCLDVAGRNNSWQNIYVNLPDWFVPPASGIQTITWDTHIPGAIDPTYDLGATFFPNNGGWTWVSVLDYIQDCVDTQDDDLINAGFRINDFGNNSADNRVQIASSANGNASLHPYIDISYNALPPTLTSATPSNSNSGILVRGGAADDATIQIYKSTSAIVSGSNYPNTGGYPPVTNANVNINPDDTWSYFDTEAAPKPSNPAVQTVVPQPGSLTVSWNTPSQISIVRYYKATRILNDAAHTESAPPTSPVYVAGTLTPTIINYQLQRRIHGSTTWYTVYQGPNTSFTDTSISDGIVYDYQVFAQNSQSTWSGAGTGTGSVAIPSPPTLRPIQVSPLYRFTVSGLCNSPDTVDIYSSDDGSNYTDIQQVASPGGSFAVDVITVAPPPPAPIPLPSVTNPDTTALAWNPGINPSITKWFAASQTKSGAESGRSQGLKGILTPPINSFTLDRRVANTNTLFTNIYTGSTPAFTDTDILPGVTYDYRIRSTNAQGTPSPYVTFQTTSALPAPPTSLNAYVVQSAPGHNVIRIAGAGLSGADAVQIERSSDGVAWQLIGYANLIGTKTGEEFYLDDIPTVIQPQPPTWSQFSYIDATGATLKWNLPTNPPSTYFYRAERIVENITGTPSVQSSATYQPVITSYTIERRQGTTGAWQSIAIGLTDRQYHDALNDNPAATNALKSSSTYDWRVTAFNDRSLSSLPSVPLEYKTFDLPPTPPTTVPPSPVVSAPFPSGTANIPASVGTLRIGWTYNSTDNSLQNDFTLSVTYTPIGDNTPVTRYWTGSNWTANGVATTVRSPASIIDVLTTFDHSTGDVMAPGPTYTFNLATHSQEGPASNNLSWTLNIVIFQKNFFDTQRIVSRIQQNRFDTERQVVAKLSGAYQASVLISWNVQAALPFEVVPSGWDATGTSWPFVVMDDDLRPQPYASIDLIDDAGFTRTFDSDSRGRIILTLPADVPPGIYTLRERGPSMPTRITPNIPVVDPWVIYHHGARHAADGADPITGITNHQIDDLANISPNKIAGGESLGKLVDIYGNNILAGVENHISAGHGNYYISGFDLTLDTDGNLTVANGRCWAANRYWTPSSLSIVLTNVTSYKVYVNSSGNIVVDQSSSYPVGSCPLYTISRNGTTLNILTDDRLIHPQNTILGPVMPVIWGPSSSFDIDYQGESLGEYLLQQSRDIINLQNTITSTTNDFENEVVQINQTIQAETAERDRASEAMLAATFATSIKHLYALHEGRPAPASLNMSAFSLGDRLSPLTTFAIDNVNHQAILPVHWSRSQAYIIRTPLVSVASAHYLDFYMIYEDTGALFSVEGSLGKGGFYNPVPLEPIRTVTSTSPYASGPTWHIASFRARFQDVGDAAVVEMRAYGGVGDAGAIIRGFVVATA